MIPSAPLVGAVVDEVVPRGKHLLHRFTTGWTLHTHLRMEGSWRVEAAGSEAARRSLRRSDLRAAIGNDQWTTLGLRLGELDVVPRTEEHRLIGHLGPDVLGDDWDPDLVARRLTGPVSATHLFNGMPPFHHRAPGPVAACLAAAARGEMMLELIGDGVHLDPETVRAVVDLVGPDRVAFVSDAMVAAA